MARHPSRCDADADVHCVLGEIDDSGGSEGVIELEEFSVTRNCKLTGDDDD